MPLNLPASQSGTNSFSQPKMILGPLLDPVPPSGYSNSFAVDQQPVMVVAGIDDGDDPDWFAQVQISPDNGVTFTDLIIHDRPVLLDAENTAILIPVSGIYRLRIFTPSPP